MMVGEGGVEDRNLSLTSKSKELPQVDSRRQSGEASSLDPDHHMPIHSTVWKTIPSTTAMSFWDRYLAPGDLRARRAALSVPSAPSLPNQPSASSSRPANASPATTFAAAEQIDPSKRRRRQNALFFGGLGFTILSLIVTRRATARKRPPYPAQFTPSNDPPPKFEGSLDAAHALALATFNTFSVFMVGLGAGAIWWDIATLEDLRDKVRAGVGFDVYGGSRESEADRELEEWVADVLSKKNGVGEMKASIVEKLYEMERKEQTKKAAEGAEEVR